MMESLWSKTTDMPAYPPLRGELRADVAVIGGGMAGILIAYFLAKAGLHPVVLEAERIGSGQTKNTTAKITSYNKIVVFIDRSPAECYNKFRMLWIGMYHLPQRRFSGGSNHSFFVEMLIS